jgi:CRISPR-associated protein Csb2
VIGLRLTFTAGRYHATGWDHHVNEGVAEWPPAPWRLLRALVAASYRLAPEERVGVEALVERLSALPLYRLPPVTKAHLRHYMPTDKSSVKVLDAFVAIEGGARNPSCAHVWWPHVELDESERALLERLCTEVAYLGRAESWVELEVTDQAPGEPNAVPADLEHSTAADEQVRLLAVLSSDGLAKQRERLAEDSGSKRSDFPTTTWEALHADVASLQRQGWSRARGSVWADYRLRTPKRIRRTVVAQKLGIHGILFQLDSRVLPRVERTIVIAEWMRCALMKAMDRSVHWQFHGKDDQQRPLTDHEHAFYLPLESKARPGRIDRVLVWTREGFESEAWQGVEALIRSKPTLGSEDDPAHPLHLVPLGWGSPDQLSSLVGAEVFGPSLTWVSATPFVMPRHTKHRRGEVVDSLEDQVRAACRKVVGHEPESIVRYHGDQPSAFGWNRFVRTRRKDAKKAPSPGFGLRLTFTQPIRGPLCLGYGFHFGLGRFVASKVG